MPASTFSRTSSRTVLPAAATVLCKRAAAGQPTHRNGLSPPRSGAKARASSAGRASRARA
jgi:hypothetical protein